MSARVPASGIRMDLGFRIGQHYNVVQTEANDRPDGTRRLPSVSSPTTRPDSDGLDQALFNRLIEWLGPDRETGGQKYESIRRRLIKLFVCRGSSISEELADRTFNRVANKLREIEGVYSGDPTAYFLSAAKFIYLESQRRERIPPVGIPASPTPDPDDQQDYDYLQRCLAELPTEDRNLIEGYYQHDKHEKIEHRKKLAEELGMGMNALRIRACRIRTNILNRVEKLRADETMKQNRPKRHYE